MQTAAVVLCILYTVTIGPAIALMVIHRNKEPIKSRVPLISIIPATFGIIFAWTNTIFFLVTTDQTTDLSLCPLYGFPYMLIPPFFCVPISIKCLMLSWKYRANVARLSKNLTSRYIRYEWIVSFKSTTIFAVIIIALSLLVAIASDQIRPPPVKGILACHFNQIAPTNTVLILNFFAWLILLLSLIKVKDTFFIKYELLALIFFTTPLLLFNLLYRSFEYFGDYPGWFGRICVEFIAALYLGALIQVVFPVCLFFYEKYFKKSLSRYSGANKFNLETFAGDRDLLQVVLDIPFFRDSFMVYCAQSFCLENLLFFMDTKSFKENLSDSERLELALKIKQEYLANDASNMINLDYKQRMDLVEKIDRKEITPEMFDEISQTVFYIIKRDPFRRWTASQDFKDVIDEYKKSTTERVSSSHASASHSNFNVRKPNSRHDSSNIPTHKMSSLIEGTNVIEMDS